MKTPEQIEFIYNELEKVLPYEETDKPKSKMGINAFTSLVGVMLSAQTRGEQTEKACKALFSLADTPQRILELSEETIARAIKPSSFYKTKAKHIIKLSEMLLSDFDGVVPDNHTDLMKLPGIGKKSADIVTRFVYDKPFIAVDTHVFRLCWRLGWTDTLDEGKTSNIVNETTPPQFKRPAHMQLIIFAQQVCTSRNPKCETCPLESVCDKRDIGIAKKNLRKQSTFIKDSL